MNILKRISGRLHQMIYGGDTLIIVGKGRDLHTDHIYDSCVFHIHYWGDLDKASEKPEHIREYIKAYVMINHDVLLDYDYSIISR